MASNATHEKVSILLVDDQESRLLTYDAILRELGQNLYTRIRASRRCSA